MLRALCRIFWFSVLNFYKLAMHFHLIELSCILIYFFANALERNTVFGSLNRRSPAAVPAVNASAPVHIRENEAPLV